MFSIRSVLILRQLVCLALLIRFFSSFFCSVKLAACLISRWNDVRCRFDWINLSVQPSVGNLSWSFQVCPEFSKLKSIGIFLFALKKMFKPVIVSINVKGNNDLVRLNWEIRIYYVLNLFSDFSKLYSKVKNKNKWYNVYLFIGRFSISFSR